MELVFYNPAKIKGEIDWTKHDSVRRFYSLFDFISTSVIFQDRTGTITTPFRSKNLFPMGDHSRNRGSSYEEICLARARDFLALSEKLKKPLGIFWSGGIDSTVVLAALKMVEPNAEILRERVRVIMSPESMQEYPEFYEKHVRGQLEILSSHSFSKFFDGQLILVSGEGNDQLFGSQLIKSIPPDFLRKPANEEWIWNYLRLQNVPDKTCDLFTRLFLQLNTKCPTGIDSFFEFLWWMNLTCKWQSVFIRMLGYLHPSARTNINADFMNECYHCFFTTPEFENWSIWNKHLKIKDTLQSYKYEAKEFIYRFAHDRNYLENKTKVGSLASILRRQGSIAAIDSEWKFHEHIAFDDVFVPQNSFV